LSGNGSTADANTGSISIFHWLIFIVPIAALIGLIWLLKKRGH
jgi:hypothetical protein